MKDDENRQLAMLVQEMERRMKKAQSAYKNSIKVKKDSKEYEKQMHKMRKELIELKDQNKNY